MTNAQFAIAMRGRLGQCSRSEPDARCQLVANDGHICGKVLDAELRHPTVCEVGPARLRAHTALVTTVRRALERSGAAVSIERVIPELYVRKPTGDIAEALMDLVTSWPGAGIQERIDVSVRSPFNSSFHKATGWLTAAKAGVAAAQGERDKHRRYGASVAPLVFEVFGRLGDEGQALLARLRRGAFDFGKRRPGGGKPVGLNLRSLRVRMVAVLLREMADTALLSLGCRSTIALGWPTAMADACADVAIGRAGDG